jgi:hypothetical protein
MVRVEIATREELDARFPQKPGQWTPAEWDAKFEQPWHRK